MIDRNYTLNNKVIVRSNNDEPYIVGTFAGYLEIGSAKIPTILGDDGQTYHSLGIVIRHNEEIVKTLDSMTPKEQWNYLSLHHKRR